MNIEEQRKAFEAWFESRYDANFMQFALDLDLYVDKHTQTCWEAWQASANRKGYKLVPLQPSNETIVAIERKVEEQLEASAIDADPFRLDGENIYKAMIGDCDDH